MALPPTNILSLCSGGGGLDLGVARALGSSRVVCYVENEVTAAERLVLAFEEGRLDDAPLWTDLRTFDAKPWRGRVDLVIAGIPCQPHSYAGKGLGADDPRDLWPVTRELLRDLGPGWFFLENVPGILPYYHARIRPDLQAMGYRVAEALVTAAEVGASHKRERLFVLAHTAGVQLPGLVAAGAGRDRSASESLHGALAGNVLGDVADRAGGGLRIGGQPPRSTRLAHGDDASVDGGVGRTLADSDLAGLEGRGEPVTGGGLELTAWPGGPSLGDFPPGPGDLAAWSFILLARPDLAPALPAESSLHGMVDGLADRLVECLCSRTDELRIVGNGVVPDQAEYAFRMLAGELS